MEMDEEIWITNKTDKKISVNVKEVYFYYGDTAFPNETIMENIGGRGYERRIIVEITKVEEGKKGAKDIRGELGGGNEDNRDKNS